LISERASNIAIEMHDRNEAFAVYLANLEKRLEEQGKQPHLVCLSGHVKKSTTATDAYVLSVVLQNNGERAAAIIKIGFRPNVPGLMQGIPSPNFNKTPLAVKVPQVRRDLRLHNWQNPYFEKELFFIPAGEVVCLTIAFSSLVGKGSFYLVHSGDQDLRIGEVD
jgi:hypothetical protein